MATREIDREEWTSSLNEFNRRHEGKIASVQEFGPGTLSHDEVRHLPFAGLIVEIDEGRADSISVMLGTEVADHVTHSITAPTEIWVRTGSDIMGEMLEIRSEDGRTMVLRFHQEQTF